MWPYGEYTKVSDSIAASLGMPVTFTLGENSDAIAAGIEAISRIVMTSNASVGDLASELRNPTQRAPFARFRLTLTTFTTRTCAAGAQSWPLARSHQRPWGLPRYGCRHLPTPAATIPPRGVFPQSSLAHESRSAFACGLATAHALWCRRVCVDARTCLAPADAEQRARLEIHPRPESSRRNRYGSIRFFPKRAR